MKVAARPLCALQPASEPRIATTPAGAAGTVEGFSSEPEDELLGMRLFPRGREPMNEIEAFARAQGMAFLRVGGAGRISVAAQPQRVVEVTVPDAVPEWFIHVRDAATGAEVFSDWCDHYRVDPADETDVFAERYAEVTRLLLAVRGVVLRVTKGALGVRTLEVQTVRAGGASGISDRIRSDSLGRDGSARRD